MEYDRYLGQIYQYFDILNHIQLRALQALYIERNKCL